MTKPKNLPTSVKARLLATADHIKKLSARFTVSADLLLA